MKDLLMMLSMVSLFAHFLVFVGVMGHITEHGARRYDGFCEATEFKPTNVLTVPYSVSQYLVRKATCFIAYPIERWGGEDE